MKHCAKFCKQSVKNFRNFQNLGPPGGQRATLLKNYKNTPVKKCFIRILMRSNATLCQTDFKQSAKNFRRFKILGGNGWPERNSLSMYFLIL